MKKWKSHALNATPSITLTRVNAAIEEEVTVGKKVTFGTVHADDVTVTMTGHADRSTNLANDLIVVTDPVEDLEAIGRIEDLEAIEMIEDLEAIEMIEDLEAIGRIEDLEAIGRIEDHGNLIIKPVINKYYI